MPEMEILFCFPAGLPSNVEVGFNALASSSGMDADRCCSFAEIRSRIDAQTEQGIVCIVSGIDRADLGEVLSCCTQYAERIKSGMLRILVMVKVADPRLLAILRKQGANEVLVSTASTKELLFKVKKSMQAIQIAYSRRKTSQELGAVTQSLGGGARKADATEAKIEWVPGLELKADTWLIDKSQVRSVMGRWLIEITGPGPSAGTWEDKESGAVWVWKPRDPSNDPFTSTGLGDRGQWFLEGRQPEFIWATNRWRVVSKKPGLYFARAGQEPVYRFRLHEGVFRISEDSQAALGKKAAMEATYESSVRLKAEKAPEAGEDVRFGEDAAKHADWNSDIGPDGKPKDWNSDIGPDGKPRAWGGLDQGRGNRFEGGRGLGMGDANGNKGYGYEDQVFASDRSIPFKSGEAAFERLELALFWIMQGERAAAQVLERDQKSLILELPPRAISLNSSLDFKATLSNGKKKKEIAFKGSLLAEEERTSDYVVVRVAVTQDTLSAVDGIFAEYANWQADSLKFLEAARGPQI